MEILKLSKFIFRYEDFFGGKKKKSVKRQSNIHNKSEDEEQEDDKGDHKQVFFAFDACFVN